MTNEKIAREINESSYILSLIKAQLKFSMDEHLKEMEKEVISLSKRDVLQNNINHAASTIETIKAFESRLVAATIYNINDSLEERHINALNDANRFIDNYHEHGRDAHEAESSSSSSWSILNWGSRIFSWGTICGQGSMPVIPGQTYNLDREFTNPEDPSSGAI